MHHSVGEDRGARLALVIRASGRQANPRGEDSWLGQLRSGVGQRIGCGAGTVYMRAFCESASKRPRVPTHEWW